MARQFAQVLLATVIAGLVVAGCVASDRPERDDVRESVAQLTSAEPAPQAQRMITFVAYYDDAAHSNLVGAATFSECPGDPSYSWGAQTSYYTVESEPCG